MFLNFCFNLQSQVFPTAAQYLKIYSLMSPLMKDKDYNITYIKDIVRIIN